MEKKTVLAIDDNKMQLDLFEKMLGAKYDLKTANSASMAINYMNSGLADVILLDIEMPNITGFEFLHDIRRIPSYMRVPIIIVSGKSGAEFFEQARNSGAFDVLSKPVNNETLVGIIEKALAQND